MSKSCIIFDCYQTLIYKKGREQALQKFLAKELKVKIPLKYLGTAFAVMYHRHKFRRPKFKTLIERRNYYRKYNKELLQIIGLEIPNNVADKLNEELSGLPYECYSDTFEILRYYRAKKYPLGLLANWTKTLERVLEKTGLIKYFDFIHSSHKVGFDKPDPRIFSSVLTKKELRNCSKIYYVGDDYELDIWPARKAGLIPILIDRLKTYPKNIDCIKLPNLTSLKGIINE